MADTISESRRLSIARRQRETAAGSDLLGLLCSITADGRIDVPEVERLRNWLFTHVGEDNPTINGLIELVIRILKDGVISKDESAELYVAIERVLPVTERGIARELKESAEGLEESEPVGILGEKGKQEDIRALKAKKGEEGKLSERNQGQWQLDPMTEPQRKFIKALGGKIGEEATKGEASLLIDQLIRKKPISSRQQMVLRFWNRQPGADEGPREISEWQDKFYADDPDRKVAWELFKEESGDNGLQGDPHRVPVGMGATYLGRIKAGRTRANSKFRFAETPSATGRNRLVFYWASGLFAIGLAFVVWFLVFPSPKKEAPPKRSIETFDQPKAVEIVTPKTEIVNTDDSAKTEMARFARSMHFTALLTVGGVRVAIIDGERCRVGDKIGPAGIYTITEINPASRSVVLEDAKGNSVRRVIQ